jgi:tetratricopeptide (TPR) repeat protein
MMLKRILFLCFLILQLNAFSQVYNVSVDDRNKAIDLTNLAIKKIEGNKLDDAVSFLVKAISIDSIFRPPYLQLYKICLLNNDYSKTLIPYIKKGQRIFVDDDELSYYLGEIYRINADLKNALLEYNVAISYSKTNGEDFHLVHNYYFNRGNCYYKADLLDSAIVDYTYALKLKPDYSFAYLNRGICLYRRGKPKEACVDWQKSDALGCASAIEYLEKYCKNNFSKPDKQ